MSIIILLAISALIALGAFCFNDKSSQAVSIMEYAEKLARGYFYDEAIEAASKAGESGKERIKEYQALKQELVNYEGKIYHIFFHSLILEPTKAFSSAKAQGYNDWMTTRAEFEKMLPLLKERGYILTDIDYIAKGNIKLPKGKKPLIISVDDVNYYEYMRGCGFADRLTVEYDGKVVCVVKNNGKSYIDSLGDVMSILDDFVAKNPDFSYRGAKGIVGVTGYEGVFGYRLKNAQEKQQAKKVADALKQNKWKIACHSYSHSQKFRDGSISVNELKKDLTKWANALEDIVGKTNIFIAPFGLNIPYNDARTRVLKDMGYNIYCGVGRGMHASHKGDMFYSDRFNMDGYTLQNCPNAVSKYFFNPAFVLDKSRPKNKK